MKKVLGIALLLTLTLPLALVARQPAGTPADDKNKDTSRSLIGFVFDRSDKPLPNAVVYLKNTKTLAVKTFIAESDSSYRFHGLMPNVDYEVWAEYQGKKSDTKTLSSFDTRPNARINLKVNLQ
jgi:Carboxypeptidase regulatory-like domain